MWHLTVFNAFRLKSLDILGIDLAAAVALTENQMRLGEDSDWEAIDSGLDAFRPSIFERDLVYCGEKFYGFVKMESESVFSEGGEFLKRWQGRTERPQSII